MKDPQSTFRCKKLDKRIMRKRCIEYQEQSSYFIEKQANYPGCTRRCRKGQEIRKELGLPLHKKPKKERVKMAEENKQSLEDALDDLEKDLEKDLETRVDDQRKEIIENSTTKKHDLEFNDVNISFKDNPELGESLRALAKKEFRTLDMQILYMLTSTLKETS
jgi:hypothetical protein